MAGSSAATPLRPPVANPLTHGLVATAAFGAASWGLGEPALTPWGLVAGIASMLVDFDERDDHASHSPWAHSVLGLGVAVIAAAAVAHALPAAHPAPLAALCGLGTHLVLDAFSAGGIYLAPRRADGRWRWRRYRCRLRYGDDDPLYNLGALAPALVGLVALVAR